MRLSISLWVAHGPQEAHSTPNTGMSLIADLDIDLLKELRASGSVRSLQNKRDDLYRVVRLTKH